MKKKITKSTKLKDVLKIRGAEEVLLKHDLPCLSCPMAAFEMEFLKLGEVAETYGIDINKLVEELNAL